MMPKQLVTVVVGPPGKPPRTPAIVVEWDEPEDGAIDELLRSFLFRYALGAPEGNHLNPEHARLRRRKDGHGARLVMHISRKKAKYRGSSCMTYGLRDNALARPLRSRRARRS